MFIKAMFILWVIIQSGTCLSADKNNSDICWIKGVVIAKLKKNIRCITTSFPGFSVSCFVGTRRRGNWERGVNKDKPLLLEPFQTSNFKCAVY